MKGRTFKDKGRESRTGRMKRFLGQRSGRKLRARVCAAGDVKDEGAGIEDLYEAI